MGCYIWYREEGTGRGCSPPRPILAVPNITARTSTASVPINVLLYNGLRCSCFKGRISSRVAHLVFDDTIVVYLCIRQRHGAWRDWGARLAVSRRLCDGSGGTGNVEVETRVVGAAATSRLADDVVDGRDELVERWTNTRLVVPTKTHYAKPVPPPTSHAVFRVDKAKYRKVIPLSHLCGSSRGSLRFYNRREPQETANIPPDEPRVSVTFRTFRACSRKKLNMFNFSARILQKRRKAVKRKETAKTVKEAYWPQVKRKPSATFRKTTAAFRRPKYLPLSYCPNCALLSNHFLTHNILRLFIFCLSLAASSTSFACSF